LSTEEVVLLSNVSQANRDAMCDILDGLAGTSLQRTGDISVTIGSTRYVITGQTGSSTAAAVSRPGGQEIIQTMPYRSELVDEVAGLGLVRASGQAIGQEFTLKQLVSERWDDLSNVEQRNAGKQFRLLLNGDPFGPFSERNSSSNERHYTRL